MRIYALAVAAVALAAWAGAPGPAKARGPLLAVADLDGSIEALEIRRPVDPLSDLIERLAELRAIDEHTDERTGLRQAIALIRIVRTSRLAPPASRSRVAAMFSHSNYPCVRPGDTARRGLRDRPTR